MRKAHFLNPTTKETRPQRIIFFDTETNQTLLGENETLHILKMGVAQLYDYSRSDGMTFREEHLIETIEGFWSWVDGCCWQGKTTYLVAHNIVFDLSVVGGFKRLAEIGWTLDSFYSKSMISIFRWSKDRCNLIGLDNGNFFRGKLEKWGKLVGLPKLEVDFETVSDRKLLAYCRRDVQIMVRSWLVWLDFLDKHKCGAFKPTIASTALNAWRFRFDDAIVHIHDDETVIELERQAYRGARTECLWVGSRDDGPFYYLDVNNMYGYIMQEYSFPTYLVGMSDNNDPYQLAYKLARYDVIAEVEVEIDEPWFPQTKGPFTCYPVGRFQTVLTTPELKLCIDKGWIRSVGRISCYRSSKLFEDYVHEFRQIRLEYEREGQEGYAKICKLLVNSLYGKFGQRGFKQELIGECPPHVVKREEVYDVKHDKHYDYIFIAGHIYREWREGESHNSFPAICAHVTAYARLHLYSLVRSVPQRHVYYMDTDSLIVDEIGYKALKLLIHPHDLGMLKVEVVSPYLIIYAPKDYKMEGRSKRKGIKPDAVEIEPGVFEQTQWMGLPGIIRDGINEGFKTKEITKHQKRLIRSGEVLPSGVIVPFRFAPLKSQAQLSE